MSHVCCQWIRCIIGNKVSCYPFGCIDARHACFACALTFVRPVYENMPIWLMMWSQVPGAPTSFKAECSFSRIVMILSAMPFSSTCNTSICFPVLPAFSPLRIYECVHCCIHGVTTPCMSSRSSSANKSRTIFSNTFTCKRTAVMKTGAHTKTVLKHKGADLPLAI